MKFKISNEKELIIKIRKELKDNNGSCPYTSTKCICEDFIKQGLGKCPYGLYIKTEL